MTRNYRTAHLKYAARKALGICPRCRVTRDRPGVYCTRCRGDIDTYRRRKRQEAHRD